MKYVLEIGSGDRSGERVEIGPGERLEIGRRGRGLAVPEDGAMSTAHFLVICDPRGRLSVRDLESRNGTWVNGRQISTDTEIQPGDRVEAGETAFEIRGQRRAPVSPLDFVEHKDEPLAVLRRDGGSLFAVLDAARDPRILELLHDATDHWECLYNGASAEKLADVAPYLVEFEPESLLLDDLVHEAWGSHWGVFLRCSRPFAEVRKHLRRFMLVELDDRQVYFRFYDPRVLPAYLPTCTSEELDAFFGPVQSYLCERNGPCVEFRRRVAEDMSSTVHLRSSARSRLNT